jgi:hypothetical protein
LIVLLRLAYLTVTTTFSFLGLLPRTNRDKEIEILHPALAPRSVRLGGVDVHVPSGPSDCLIWNQSHLRHALREFEAFYNEHRPHRALQQPAPLRSLPDPDTGPGGIAPLDIRRRDRLGGVLKEYRRAA